MTISILCWTAACCFWCAWDRRRSERICQERITEALVRFLKL